MEIAAKRANEEQLNEKVTMNRWNREQETREKLNHIDYILNNDFQTENPDTCKSHLSNNRYIPYHWKGMSE